VPSLLIDLLLTAHPEYQGSSSTPVTPVLSGCVRLLRALARDNEVIQRRIFDRFEALLGIHAIHSDIALLLSDVSYYS